MALVGSACHGRSPAEPDVLARATVTRIVYCTARISGSTNPSGAQDQDVYIKALLASRSVDHVEFGKYIEKVRIAPLATATSNGRPVLVRSAPPMLIKDAARQNVPNATFMASVAYREEKGSEVNVASHLFDRRPFRHR